MLTTACKGFLSALSLLPGMTLSRRVGVERSTGAKAAEGGALSSLRWASVVMFGIASTTKPYVAA